MHVEGAIGIAGVCTCTLAPGHKDHIENCTVGDRMGHLLGTQFGYDMVKSTLNMSSVELDVIIEKMGRTQDNPRTKYGQAILSFFGHANAHSVKLADGEVSRQVIIEKFKSQFPPDVIKIVIFECCRLVYPPTCEAIQETNKDAMSSLSGLDHSQTDIQYTVTENMIIIEATNYDNKAYYSNGCGLFTKHFTELAPRRNVHLGELLIEVRSKVSDEAKSQEKKQVLQCREVLFHAIHLLAESRGEGEYACIVWCFMPCSHCHFSMQLEFLLHLNLPVHQCPAPG